jgi:hypothetical protein
MTEAAVADARRREIATEHMLFGVMKYVEARHPGLLDMMEQSLDHLGDPADDDSKDDEAVRAIARRMIASARHGTDA